MGESSKVVLQVFFSGSAAVAAGHLVCRTCETSASCTCGKEPLRKEHLLREGYARHSKAGFSLLLVYTPSKRPPRFHPLTTTASHLGFLGSLRFPPHCGAERERALLFGLDRFCHWTSPTPPPPFRSIIQRTRTLRRASQSPIIRERDCRETWKPLPVQTPPTDIMADTTPR